MRRVGCLNKGFSHKANQASWLMMPVTAPPRSLFESEDEATATMPMTMTKSLLLLVLGRARASGSGLWRMAKRSSVYHIF